MTKSNIPPATTVVNEGNIPSTYSLALTGPSTELIGTLTQNAVITITGWTIGAQLLIVVAQNSTGGFTLDVVVNGTDYSMGVNLAASTASMFLLVSPDGTNADVAPLGASPSATTTSLGLIKLAGALGGTAASPTVPGLTSKADLVGGLVPMSELASGTPNGTQFVRDDGTLAVPAGGASALMPTALKSSGTYGASVGDLVLVDLSTASVTITLPSAPSDQKQVGWKIVKYTAGNTLTINCAGSDVFEVAGGVTTSAPSPVLDDAKIYQYQHSTGIWIACSGDQARSQNDLRYVGSASQSASLLAKLPGTIIADRGQTGGNGQIASVAQINTNSRHVFVAQYDCADLRPVFANHYADTEPNSATEFKATIEYPLGGGVYYKVYFASKRLGIAEPGALLIPDPVGLRLKKGQQFAVRTYTQYTSWTQTLTPSATLTAGTFVLTVNGVALTINYNATAAQIATSVTAVVGQNNVVGSGGPVNTTAVTLTFTVPNTTMSAVSTGLTGGTIAVAIADKVVLGLPVVGSNGDAFSSGSTATSFADGEGTITGVNNAPGPAFILGRAFKNGVEQVRAPVLVGVGDSIVSGTGGIPKPTGSTATPWSLHPGWFNQLASSLGVPWLNLALPGELGSNFVAAGGQHRQQLLQVGTAMLCDYPGVNDIKGGQSLATLQANVLTIGFMAQTRGIKAWQTTITPYQSTSTDSWTSTGSQTTPYGGSSAEETVRENYNAWIRDGMPIDATALTPDAVGASSNVLRAGAFGHPWTGWVEVTNLCEPSQNAGTWAPGSWTGTITTVSGGAITIASTVTGTLRVGDALVSANLPAGSLVLTIVGSTVTVVGSGGALATPTATATGTSAATAMTVDGIHPVPSKANDIMLSIAAAIGTQLTA